MIEYRQCAAWLGDGFKQYVLGFPFPTGSLPEDTNEEYTVPAMWISEIHAKLRNPLT